MSINRIDIDFKGGVVTDDTLFITDFDGPVGYIDEDILLVEYPNDFSVDVSFHEGSNNLSVNVICGSNWEAPVYRKFIGLRDKAGLLKSIRKPLILLLKARFGYIRGCTYVLYNCLFLAVAVQAVTEFDNKATLALFAGTSAASSIYVIPLELGQG